MPIEYTYNEETKIIDTNAHGIVHVSEIVDYLQTILSDDQIEYGATEIFSLENAADLIMTYSQAQIFKSLWATYKVRIGKRILVIAPTDKAFGLFRMLASVVEMSDEEAGNAFIVLRSRDKIIDYV